MAAGRTGLKGERVVNAVHGDGNDGNISFMSRHCCDLSVGVYQASMSAGQD